MRRRRGSSRFRRLVVIGGITALLAYAYWALAMPMGTGAAVAFEVKRGQSARAVAAGLEARGIIRSRVAFLALGLVTGKYRHLQTGEYSFPRAMTAAEVLDALYLGTHRAWTWLTIPEGLTLRQIADAVGQAKLADRDEFAALSRTDFRPGFPLPSTGLEGYLFPDTYRIDAGTPPRRIAGQMLGRFREAVWRGLFESQGSYRGRSVNEIITLASLVEAEAKQDAERPMIAGVLMNRLRRGQRLECDATVQYALGSDRKQRLLYRDLEVESPYNTYRHAGLPPGPICSPGVASIRAAMRPASVPYLYYVARPDGSHVFSKTLAEHRQAATRLRLESQGATP